MAHDLPDPPRPNRFSVVSVDKAAGTLRVRDRAEACTDLSCGDAMVVTDEGASRDLDRLNAGDIVALEEKDGRAEQIRVVRRALDEYSSPGW